MARPFSMPPRVPLAEQTGGSFTKLVELMQRLLAQDGCPWDREQDFASLRRYVLEEACEVIDAIDSGDMSALAEELGDLGLQVVFLAELGRREGSFGPDDVVWGICEKLVRRHPHVFGDGQADDPRAVERTWEAIKREEKGERALLDGIPRALPALHRAQKMSDTVSRVGFDWPDQRGSRAKVVEELGELDEAIESGDSSRVEAELGDLLFAVVNLARHHGVNAEEALRKTGDRFGRRFHHVEQEVERLHAGWPRDERGRPTRGIDLDELERYWEAAKRREGQEGGQP